MHHKSASITFELQNHARGKTQVRALCDGEMIHCGLFVLADAKERAKYIREVAGRALHCCGVEPISRDLESALLAMMEQMANPQDHEEPASVVEYTIVEGSDDPDRDGIYSNGGNGPVQLANCIVRLTDDVESRDGPESRRVFRGDIIVHGTNSPFEIPAEDFGNGNKLAAALFVYGGLKVQIHCRVEHLIRAISAISNPTKRTTTNDFGWTVERDAYLTPSVRIDADGIHATTDEDPLHVCLAGDECARRLDLAVPTPGEIDALKRHITQDLLGLHDRLVTYSLLAATALGVLFPFVSGKNRPAIWLAGTTGTGRSFLARLFQNFFGDFPIELGKSVGGWTSTANFLQVQGFYFKDSLYLIDDYKPDVTRHHEVVRLLQNYGDGSARGRLNADSTTKVSREIRGILVSTGESMPEQSASSIARTVVINVLTKEKDVERGSRCLEFRARYPALMADFIRHVIAKKRGIAFVERVATLQRSYYDPIAGRQNDLRIASNLALLGAAFEEFVGYLGQLAPSIVLRRLFVRHDLPALRDKMLATVLEQQPSEVFLETLRALIRHGRVRFLGHGQSSDDPRAVHAPSIGKYERGTGRDQPILAVNMSLALEAVQESLRKQSRPALAANERSLLEQLAADGHLLDNSGQSVAPGNHGRKTSPANVGGRTMKVFRVSAVLLIDADADAALRLRHGAGPRSDR